MKQKITIALLLVSALMMSACTSSKEAGQSSSVENTEDTTQILQSAEEESLETFEDLMTQMEISEYLFKEQTGAKHLLVIQNNSDKTVTVSSHSEALGKKGNVVGEGSGTVEAIGPGAVSYILEDIKASKSIFECEYEIEVLEAEDYASVVENLKTTVETVDGKAVVSTTNEGIQEVENVQELAVFTKEGVVTNIVSKDIADSSSPLTAETTLTKDFEAGNAEFDDVQVYVRGYNKTK